MKSLKTLKLVLISLMGIMLMAGCSKATKQEWAYIHEPGETVLTLSDNGKAEFKGVKYTYTLENDYLTLTDKDGNEIGMRFVPDGDRMFLYEPAVYEYTGEGEPDGIIGFWQEVGGNLSFEFTDKGTFREDYYSPGYYVVDEEQGMIQLIYNDMYPDTFIYYHLDGNILTVEYPWPMVPTEK